MKKNEYILISILIGAAVLCWLGYQFLFQKPAVSVEVSVSGTVVETLDLNQPADLIIHGIAEGTNHLIIEDGQVSIREASCPDKICVHQGTIRYTGETIVCLPNQVVVTIAGGQ